MLNLELNINNETYQVSAYPGESLFAILRRLGFSSVKFGDEHGKSGADTVLMDGKPMNSYLLLAAQAEGHEIETIEMMGEHPHQGWKETRGLHILQQEFVKTGAITPFEPSKTCRARPFIFAEGLPIRSALKPLQPGYRT